MKQCKKCKQDKDLSAYYNSKYAKDGKMNICKICDKIRVNSQNKKKKDNEGHGTEDLVLTTEVHLTDNAR